jgi:hypothetical protein
MCTMYSSFYCRDFRFQWIITCCFVAAVALFFSDVYADTLAPFFDTILPIVTHKSDTEEGKKEGQLEAQVQELSKRLEFPLGKLLSQQRVLLTLLAEVSKIDNFSQGVSHSNAYTLYVNVYN